MGKNGIGHRENKHSKFLNHAMEKSLDTPKVTEYLIDFVRCIPKKIIKGSGILNNNKYKYNNNNQ